MGDGDAYDRAVLVEVLVYHQRTADTGCACGWGVLGASFAEHVAAVYEESVIARAE
jgi:16S rRNA G1207 methylase RsmC